VTKLTIDGEGHHRRRSPTVFCAFTAKGGHLPVALSELWRTMKPHS